MAKYIPKAAVVAEIDKMLKTKEQTSHLYNDAFNSGRLKALKKVKDILDTLEVKELDVWKTVDNINHPQADKNKIYCVFTKDRYILATVINHPKDEELLQWKCTEFPHHRYDMCEGDKYMVIN